MFFNFWKWKLEYWSQLDFEIQAKKDAKSKRRRMLKSETDAKVQIFDIALSTIVFNQSSIEQTGILLICHVILTSEVNSNICTEIDCMHKKINGRDRILYEF